MQKSGQIVRSALQALGNESEKDAVAAVPLVAPAQMLVASRTDCQLPARAGEPGKIRRERSQRGTAWCGSEALKGKDLAVRIGKNVLVGTGHRDAPGVGRDGMGTGGAYELRRCAVPGKGRRGGIGRLAGMSWPLRVLPQDQGGSRGGRLECRKDLHIPEAGYTLGRNRQPGLRHKIVATGFKVVAMRQYLGHLAASDPLHSYLRDAILPQLTASDREPRWRVYRVSPASDVYLYEDKWTQAQVVGKFYAHSRGLNGSNAPQTAENERQNLDFARSLGLDALPDYVVRPLGVNPDLGDLLVIEHIAGEQLDSIIEAAAGRGRDERLFRKLSGLARFFARLHNATAGPELVDFARTQGYYDRVVGYLAAHAGISARRINRLRELGHGYAGRAAMWQDVQVAVHGDATPSNFLFGRGQDVYAIDLERMHRDDRVYDVGRLCGELKHCFLQMTGDIDRAEPFVGHFLWEYSGHFPDREQTFAALTARLPFHLGLTLLRIARNSWLEDGYRNRLVHEAKVILLGGLL